MKFSRTVLMMITSGIMTGVILAGCGNNKGEAVEKPEKPAKTFPVITDAELAELVPDFVDAQAMPWLAGTWGVMAGSDYNGSSCSGGGALDIATSGYVFEVTSDPEPVKAEAEKTNEDKTSGTVNVSKGEDPGFFNFTPPKWDDAYFRLKPRSKDRLTAHLYMFSSERTEWLKTHEFEFERCET